MIESWVEYGSWKIGTQYIFATTCVIDGIVVWIPSWTFVLGGYR